MGLAKLFVSGAMAHISLAPAPGICISLGGCGPDQRGQSEAEYGYT